MTSSTPRFTRRKLHMLALASALSWRSPAWAAADSSQAPTKYEPVLLLGKTKLLLNGHGSRKKAYFWMYDLALYLQSQATTAEQAVAMEGPKVLSFVARRELPGGDLGRLFVKGMGQNASADAMQRHVKNATRLIEIFSGKTTLKPGDDFRMEFQPGKGTTFYILGQAQGDPVGDAEFFAMALNIWLGPMPADEKLKQALLGG